MARLPLPTTDASLSRSGTMEDFQHAVGPGVAFLFPFPTRRLPITHSRHRRTASSRHVLSFRPLPFKGPVDVALQNLPQTASLPSARTAPGNPTPVFTALSPEPPSYIRKKSPTPTPSPSYQTPTSLSYLIRNSSAMGTCSILKEVSWKERARAAYFPWDFRFKEMSSKAPMLLLKPLSWKKASRSSKRVPFSRPYRPSRRMYLKEGGREGGREGRREGERRSTGRERASEHTRGAERVSL